MTAQQAYESQQLAYCDKLNADEVDNCLICEVEIPYGAHYCQKCEELL